MRGLRAAHRAAGKPCLGLFVHPYARAELAIVWFLVEAGLCVEWRAEGLVRPRSRTCGTSSADVPETFLHAFLPLNHIHRSLIVAGGPRRLSRVPRLLERGHTHSNESNQTYGMKDAPIHSP